MASEDNPGGVALLTAKAKAEIGSKATWTLLMVLLGALTGPEVVDAVNDWLRTHLPHQVGIVAITVVASLVKNFTATRVGDPNSTTFKKPSVAPSPDAPIVMTAPAALLDDFCHVPLDGAVPVPPPRLPEEATDTGQAVAVEPPYYAGP